jgi:S1-C subfamily serine protease
MNTPFLKIIICLFSILFIPYSNSNSQSLTAEQIYKKVSGAVVVIHAYNDNDELATQGSGVVLNDKGYVVTNYHVLSGNERVEILHGKEVIPYVDIIGIDVDKDILILKIEAKRFPSIKISNSNSLNIGQRVYTIGSPMGLENSISEGIISGLRSYDELRRNFIQISASISPGSSGGAVVNDKGELIGISTLTMKEGQNLNFAIPINDILKVEIGSYSKNNTYKDINLSKKGNNAFEDGDYENAIKYYSLYIEKYPNDAEAYNNRGNAKNKLKDYKGAIQDYDKAIEIRPNDADLYLLRGFVKDNLKDFSGAIQDYNKVIEINPKDSPPYYFRGLAKLYSGDKNGACLDWSIAGELGDSAAYDLIKEHCNNSPRWFSK